MSVALERKVQNGEVLPANEKANYLLYKIKGRLLDAGLTGPDYLKALDAVALGIEDGIKVLQEHATS